MGRFFALNGGASRSTSLWPQRSRRIFRVYRRISYSATAALVLLLLFMSFTGMLAWTIGTQHSALFSYNQQFSPANSTLNFANIFVINLPSRLDRRDALTIMSLYTNITPTVCTGVTQVAENVRPLPRKEGSLKIQEYNVYRAHANLWRRMVEERLPHALILEDDNDWNVNIREQIPRVMKAMETLNGQNTWDIIYLGSCSEEPTSNGSWTIIRGDSENVGAVNHEWVETILNIYLSEKFPRERILQKAVAPECTNSYAITQRGARRLLYFLGQYLDQKLDLAIKDLLKEGRLVGYSVLPPLFVQWKTLQRPEKDTDVGYDVSPIVNWGFTNSTRQAIQRWGMRPCKSDSYCGL